MKAAINGQQLEIIDRTLIVSKSKGIYECEFVFDESWDGWDKTAVFECSGVTKEWVIVNGKAQVPWEVIVDNGVMRVGVFGTLDEKVMPTIWSAKMIVELGTPTGATSSEPTPSIYAQILHVANEAKETAEDAHDKAVEAQGSAQASAEDAEAWAVGQRNGEDVSSGDPTYQNNSKFWAQLAQQGAEQSGFAWFDVNDEDGQLYVTITPNLAEQVRFEINDNTGELEVIIA